MSERGKQEVLWRGKKRCTWSIEAWGGGWGCHPGVGD